MDDVETQYPGLGQLLLRVVILTIVTMSSLASLEAWHSARIYGLELANYERVRALGVPLRNVIIGPSQALHGLDPRQLAGPQFDNLGMDGAGPSYLRRWYAYFRTHRPAPDRAILLVPWYVLRRDCLWRRFEHDGFYLTWREVLALAAEPGVNHDTLLHNRLALLKYRRFLLTGVPAGFDRPNAWEAQGFYPYRGFPGNTAIVEPRYNNPIDPEEVTAFASLLHALRDDGVRVVVVLAPVFAATFDHGGADEAQIRALVADFGLPVLSYRQGMGKALSEDPQNFLDWRHLNEQGSLRFSRILGQDLARMGFLSD